MNETLTKFTFEIGRHNEQAHEYIDELIDDAYRRPTTPQERIQTTEELTEAYYAQIGQWPSQGVLSRLAWYIVFDEMTDKNAHKVLHAEYPILSEHQLKTRREREQAIDYVYTGKDDDTIGRIRDNDSGAKVRVYDYMTPKRDNALVPPKYLDLYSAIENADLTDRQRQAIDLVYFEDMTQTVAADVMGVSQPNVNAYIDAGIRKMREYLMRN